jgi:hypothetical protein
MATMTDVLGWHEDPPGVWLGLVGGDKFGGVHRYTVLEIGPPEVLDGMYCSAFVMRVNPASAAGTRWTGRIAPTSGGQLTSRSYRKRDPALCLKCGLVLP